MNRSQLLAVVSVVSILLLSLHVADDIAHGFDEAGLINFIGIAALAGLLYATLVFRERLGGRIVMFLTAIFAVGMPVIHLRSSHINETAHAAGGLVFIWTLFALGITGPLGLALTAHDLIKRRKIKKA